MTQSRRAPTRTRAVTGSAPPGPGPSRSRRRARPGATALDGLKLLARPVQAHELERQPGSESGSTSAARAPSESPYAPPRPGGPAAAATLVAAAFRAAGRLCRLAVAIPHGEAKAQRKRRRQGPAWECLTARPGPGRAQAATDACQTAPPPLPGCWGAGGHSAAADHDHQSRRC